MSNTLSEETPNKLSKKILVVGLGNRLLGDEGIGLHITDHLRQIPMPSYVDVVDCGCDLLSLVSCPDKPQKIIIVDAIRAGGKAGETYRFNYDELEATPTVMCSAHQIRGVDALRLLKELSPGLADCEIVVIGVEPQAIELTTGLSEEARKSVACAISLILDELSPCPRL